MSCKICHREGCQIDWHAIASNSASNVESPASNKGDRYGKVLSRDSDRAPDGSGRQVKSSDLPVSGTLEQAAGTSHRKTARAGESSDRKQRWSKVAYKAYMKEYMRRRRARESGST
jgi:hypothetical protein